MPNTSATMSQQAHFPKVVFFISGVRSGATVCRKMLATHPRVRDVGEIFNSNNGYGYYPYWQKTIYQNAANIFPEKTIEILSAYLASLQLNEQLILVDVKYEHLGLLTGPWQLPFGKPMLLTFIEAAQCKIIHLTRQPFHSVVSNLIATQTGRYHIAADVTEKVEVGVSLDRSKVIGAIKARAKLSEFVDNSLSKRRTFRIEYEHMFDSSGLFDGALCAALAQFLEISNEFIRAPVLRKVINRPLCEVVTNFADIADLQQPL